MGSKAKDVGGGPAVPVANDWAGFLRQGLGTGTFGGIGGTAPDTRGRQQTPADGMMRTDPVGQTKGIGGYINNALSGNLGAQQYTPDTAALQGQLGAGKYNFAGFNPSTVDFSQFQNPLAGFNATAQNVEGGSNIANDPRFQGLLADLKKYGNMDPQQLAQLTQSITGMGGAGAGPAAQVDMGNVNIAPYQALWDRQRAMGQADVRARYGAAGGAAFGTPAAFAESNYLNENDATRAAAMADIGRQQQALNLQEGQINTGNYNAWQNNLTNLAGVNSGLYGNLYGSNIGALSSGAGLMSNALASDASNALQASMANASNKLNALGLNLDARSRMGGMNLDALRAASQQGVDIQGLYNQYQGMGAQNQQASAGMDADILSNILGFQGDAAKFGEGQRQFDLGLGGGVMDQLMNQYGRMADKGISQRQTVMQPSGFQNAISGISGLAGAISPLISGGFNPLSILGGNNQQAINLGRMGNVNQVASGGLVTEDGGIYQGYASGGLVGGLPNFLKNMQPQGGSAGGFAGALKQFNNPMVNMRAQPQGNAFGLQRPQMQRPPLNFGGAPNPNVNPIGGMNRPMIGPGISGPPAGGLRQVNQPMINMQRQMPQIGAPLMPGGFGGARRGVFGFAEGGEVPPTSDTVPAMLTPGENVITKHVSDLLGPFAQMLNDLKTPEQIKKVRKAIGDAMGAGLDESFVASMQEGGMPQ